MDKDKSKSTILEDSSIAQWLEIDGSILLIVGVPLIGSALLALSKQNEDWIKAGLVHTYEEQGKSFHEGFEKNTILAPGMVLALNNLATLHYRQAKFAEAETEFKQVCLYSRYYAPSRPDIFLPIMADSLNSLGLLYQSKEDYKKAEAALAGSISTYEFAHKNFLLHFSPLKSHSTPSNWLAGVTNSYYQGPDRFFDQDKLSRLEELMEKWRGARDVSSELTNEDQQELEKLVDEELEATIARLEEREKLTGK